MEIVVKVEHYLPTGYACVSIVKEENVKRLPLWINRPEKECERAIRKVIRQMQKLDIGSEMTCWTTHKLDQLVAQQREWDSRENEDDYN